MVKSEKPRIDENEVKFMKKIMFLCLCVACLVLRLRGIRPENKRYTSPCSGRPLQSTVCNEQCNWVFVIFFIEQTKCKFKRSEPNELLQLKFTHNSYREYDDQNWHKLPKTLENSSMALIRNDHVKGSVWSNR